MSLLASHTEDIRATAGLLVLTIALLAEVQYAPYNSMKVDGIAVRALCTSTMSLYLGLFMFIAPESNNAIGYSIITLNILFLIKFGWTLLGLVRRRWKKIAMRKAKLVRLLS